MKKEFKPNIIAYTEVDPCCDTPIRGKMNMINFDAVPIIKS